MKRIYENEETIINIIGDKLASMETVEYAMCSGIDLEPNKVYEIEEGYLLIVFDEDTCELDYILTKRK